MKNWKLRHQLCLKINLLQWDLLPWGYGGKTHAHLQFLCFSLTWSHFYEQK